jgi:Putative adhesin
MRSRYWLIFLALGPATAFAWGDGCELRAERAAGVDAKGVEKVIIRAGAGDMKVIGRGNAVRIEARGVACAAKQELLDRSQIVVRREGNVVYVETELPDANTWSWGKNEYAYIDIGIALPSSLPVEAVDSSGDAVFEDLQTLKLQDSSGDLNINRIAGLAEVTDSSGDLEIDGAGMVLVHDSSGDIEIDDVRGDVDVALDSSGDIHVEKVAGSVRVEQDSSGDIRVEDVKGNFVVDSDSSGSIYAANISGNFTVSEDSSGSIEHESIGGKISIPSNKRDDDDDVEK